MGNTQELRFQGLCLVNREGYLYMRQYYDDLPELVRNRLKSSSYNLCAACVRDQAYRYAKSAPEVPHYLNAIEAMEQELKRKELVEAERRIIHDRKGDIHSLVDDLVLGWMG